MGKFLASIVRAAQEISLPMRMRSRKDAALPSLSRKEDGIAVSLTTFPARIGNVWITLDSLFRQTVLPDRIILTLTQEEFPGGTSDLPESVLRFMEAGLEVVFLPYNLRCHNKYEYARRPCREATVITVDDDCLYRPDTIARLLDLHRKYPGAVCCNIAAVIDTEHFHEYSYWKKTFDGPEADSRNVALGFAGVLYPSGLEYSLFLDRDLAMKLSPTADDLWLKAVELSRGIPVARGDFFPRPVTIKSSQKTSLRKVNKGARNNNDIQWKALDSYFHLREKFD